MEQEIKTILDREFKSVDIGKDYGGFAYVKPHLVIRRLNEAFGPDGWEFVPEERVVDDFSIVQFGKIGIRNEKGDWIWKHNCGGKQRRFLKDAPKTPENYVNIINDYKSAVSNCLKRCAMMLGVALHLYGDTEQSDEDASQETGKGTNNPPVTPAGTNTEEGKGEPLGKDNALISGLKARIQGLESSAIAYGVSQDKIDVLRGEVLGNTTLDHSAGKLKEYGDQLYERSLDE